ncbi:MAG: cyclic nucleotide-binding domain-containing protein [Planctomycetota bacterium]
MNLPYNPYYLSEQDMLNLVDAVERQGEADWQLFLSYAEEIHLPPGGVLIRQGDADRSVFVLTSGMVDVTTTRGEGPTETVASVQPVAIFGEQTFLDGQSRTATVTASEDVIVHRLRLSDFDRLRSEEPEIACAFLFDVARTASLRIRDLVGE